MDIRKDRPFVFGDPSNVGMRDAQIIEAESLEQALEVYCSTRYSERGIVGQVIQVVEPGKIVARTLRWRMSNRGIRHKLQNTKDELNFFPVKLNAEKMDFYLKRRQDRDIYWQTILRWLLSIKLHSGEWKVGEWNEQIWEWT